MTDRDRLIELIHDSDYSLNSVGLADYLIANGVIVPPCKVGNTVYVPWRWNGEHGIAVANVQEIKIYDSKNHSMFLIDLQSDDEEFNQSFGGWKLDKSIGETIFLFYEEAEKALGRSKGSDR